MSKSHKEVRKELAKKHGGLAEISHEHGPTSNHPYKHVDIYLYNAKGKKKEEKHGFKTE